MTGKPTFQRLALAMLLCSTAFAGPLYAEANVPMVRGSKVRDYARVTFNWPEKVKFNASSSGNKVTIRFDRRAEPNFGNMLSNLHPHVIKADLAGDGKTIVLTMDKPYRVRTFMSGTSAGVDLLNIDKAAAPAPAQTATKEAVEPPKTTLNLPAQEPAAGPKNRALTLPGATPPTQEPEEKIVAPAPAEEKPPVIEKPTAQEIAEAEKAKKEALELEAKKKAEAKAKKEAEKAKALAEKEARQKAKELAEKPVEKPVEKPAEKVETPPPATTREEKIAAQASEDTLAKVQAEQQKQAAAKLEPQAEKPAAEAAPAPKPEQVKAEEKPAVKVETPPVATAKAETAPVAATESAPVEAPAATKTPATPEAPAKAETPPLVPQTAVNPKTPVTPAESAAVTPVSSIPATANAAAPEQATTSPTAAAVATTPSQPVAIGKAPEGVKGEKLALSVSQGKYGPELVFPWKDRVAAAAFVRNGKLWVVFNRPAMIELSALSKASLPLRDAEQREAGEYTVLRFGLNEKTTPIVSKKENGTEWVIALSPKRKRVKEVVDIQPTTAPPLKPHVLVSVLESADSMNFTDPETGAELVITPFYQPGQGIFPARQFVEFSLLATAQGMAVEKFADTLRVAQLRNGLKITTPEGLSLTPQLPEVAADELEFFDEDAPTLFPYSSWKVADDKAFTKKRSELTKELLDSDAEKANRVRLKLAQLYLGQGYAQETLGMLDYIKMKDPVFYADYKLAAYRGAANFLLYRLPEAQIDFSAPELADMDEMKLWKDLAAELLGSPTQHFNYLAANDEFIRYYPPAIRQKLAIIAADMAINRRNFNTALMIFDSLNKDKQLDPIQKYVDFMLAKISSETGQTEAAAEIWTKMADNVDDSFVRARALYSLTAMQLAEGAITADEAIKNLEKLRILWRGDNLEMNVLSLLGKLYLEKEDYVNGLRTLRELVSNFPNTPDATTTAKQMAETFNHLFNDGAADAMPPLSALSLYYEFRNLTPVGSPGDEMIRNLADRLVEVDLLDRAAALLNHQVRFRLSGEERSRVGARLALIYLMARQPKQAWEALEISNYGANPGDLQRTRDQLAAQAMSDLGETDKALALLEDDRSADGQMLKLNIFWSKKDWPNVIATAEDMLANRKDITAPLTQQESDYLLKLALAYTFEHDSVQLQYLRDYFGPLMKDNPGKNSFLFITDNSGPVDPENFQQVTRDISRIQSFIDTYQSKVRKDGLSSAVN